MSDLFGNMNMSLGQFGFMAEAEGEDSLIDTFDARWNAALSDIKISYSYLTDEDIDLTKEIDAILFDHNIDPSTLTDEQIMKINDIIG